MVGASLQSEVGATQRWDGKEGQELTCRRWHSVCPFHQHSQLESPRHLPSTRCQRPRRGSLATELLCGSYGTCLKIHFCS